ncbi:hypothetical protein MMC11_008854, partial [Xylographa trunciseda]|nr:hypothetical protein [Xylographa trunciseda]
MALALRPAKSADLETQEASLRGPKFIFPKAPSAAWQLALEKHLATLSLDNSKRRKRDSFIRVLEALRPILEPLKRFEGAIDVLVQTNGVFCSPVWGPIRMVITMAGDHLKSVEKLARILERVMNILPRAQSYEELLQSSEAARNSLGTLCADLIDFCIRAVQYHTLPFYSFITYDFNKQFDEVWEKLNYDSQQMDWTANAANIEQGIKFREASIRTRDEDLRMALQRWLLPSNVQDDAERYWRELIPASCDLIFASFEFRTWESSTTSNILRIVAYPGAGKTFFASSVIQRLKVASSDVAYFFCRNGIQDRDTTIYVLRTLLSQTIRLQHSAYEVLAPLYQESGRASADSISDMQQCFRLLLDSRSQVLHLVIDGIDELTDKGLFFDVVKSIISASKSTIKVLVTGRDEVGISKAFQPYPLLRISPDMTQKPITDYVARKIAECDNISQSWLRETVLSRVLDKSEGLWLFAKLMTDAVTELPTVAAIERQLQNLPSDLSVMYYQILERHADALAPWQLQWAQQLFLWIDSEDYFWLDHGESVGRSKIDADVVRVIFQAAGNGELPLNPLNIAKTLGGPMVRIKIKDIADVGMIEYIHLSARDYILSTSDTKSYASLPRLLRLRRLRALFRGVTALWFFESSQEALDLLQWFRSDPEHACNNWWDSPYPFVVYGLWNSFHVPALPETMDDDEYHM